MVPPGESFEFILERDKNEKIKKIIARNDGKVISERFMGDDVLIRVKKI